MFNNFIFFIPINKFKEEVIQTSPLIELISQNAYGFTIKVDKSLITFEKDCYSIKAAFKISKAQVKSKNELNDLYCNSSIYFKFLFFKLIFFIVSSF